MKLKVQQVFDAAMAVAQIMREARQMPQKGKYRLSRLHAKLLPEFTMIAEQRDALIKTYGVPVESNGVEQPPGTFTVPPEKMAEFIEAWKKIAEEEIEVEVEPIPLSALDLGAATNGSIEASELAALGELVSE